MALRGRKAEKRRQAGGRRKRKMKRRSRINEDGKTNAEKRRRKNEEGKTKTKTRARGKYIFALSQKSCCLIFAEKSRRVPAANWIISFPVGSVSGRKYKNAPPRFAFDPARREFALWIGSEVDIKGRFSKFALFGSLGCCREKFFLLGGRNFISWGGYLQGSYFCWKLSHEYYFLWKLS